MYQSKYYTCEEIDQRLLQNYFDDLVQAGYKGSKEEYFNLFIKILEKIKANIEGVLSTNDFTNTLKDKLENLEIPDNVSELNNDASYQTEAEVGKLIENFYQEKIIKPILKIHYNDFENYIGNVDLFMDDVKRTFGEDDFNKYDELVEKVEQLIKDVEALKSQPIPGVEVLTESEIENTFKELL